MVFQLFAAKVLIILAYALSANGLAIPADNSLEKRDEGFLKLDFDVIRDYSHPGGSFDKRYNDLKLNNSGLYYSITLNFGTDGQPINVALDTGSSDLWVPSIASEAGGYDHSKSTNYKNTGEPFSITYVKGTASGTFVTDTVSIPNGPSLPNFQFAECDASGGGVGILGISYISLEALENGESHYTNFPAALKDAGVIKKNAYSIYLNDAEATSGSVIFGGYDTEKYEGELATLPVVDIPTNGLAVSLNTVTDSKGFHKPALVSATLDSGTSLAYLPTYVTQDIAEAAGVPYDPLFQTLEVTCDTKFEGELGFNFDNNVTITVPLQSLLVDINGTCEFALQGNFQTGGNNILGDIFLRNAYVVYDLDDNTIQIAQAKYTDASNIVPIE